TTCNVLLLHGQLPGLGEQRGTAEYGGALLNQHDLAPAQWDYVALGHYHVAQPVAANAWYAGSLEYVTPNPWGQLQDEEELGRRALDADLDRDEFVRLGVEYLERVGPDVGERG